MRTDQPVCCRFESELTSLIAQNQSSGLDGTRDALFEALRALEGRARSEAASALTLRKIAEARFLVGILRDAVRPFPVAPLRTVLRVRERPRAPVDLDA
ncbi:MULTISPECIES: hypothetical protein [Methylobacterium]|jgi:hypothetical protein|uniref:Uncharacterized protein n=1 Tax=Methylobacterium longum TaxID=767694 RepID=A0ABT8AWL0_9HYPH|nr:MULTISPECIES: hypothetical protein [Methylobacterium]MCJ2100574.1 hypothetical protein [Methylobacterium sp. E-046]MDN3573673.1 hypothetical protein [Methylobacterium longum]GJE11165.1 hypothetical protein FOHLNKBM_2206 [Methylobacterium longum]